jgi:hypothetical protein
MSRLKRKKIMRIKSLNIPQRPMTYVRDTIEGFNLHPRFLMWISSEP